MTVHWEVLALVKKKGGGATEKGLGWYSLLKDPPILDWAASTRRPNTSRREVEKV